MTDVLKDIIAGWAEIVEEDPHEWLQATVDMSGTEESHKRYLALERELTGEEWLEAAFAREAGVLRRDLAEEAAVEFVSSSAYPSLDRSPAKNWLEKVGGLPSYIERIAKHVHFETGRPISMAIAIAVNMVKRMCATGHTNVGQAGAAARTKACQATAEWEAAKLKSKAQSKAKKAAT